MPLTGAAVMFSRPAPGRIAARRTCGSTTEAAAAFPIVPSASRRETPFAGLSLIGLSPLAEPDRLFRLRRSESNHLSARQDMAFHRGEHRVVALHRLVADAGVEG